MGGRNRTTWSYSAASRWFPHVTDDSAQAEVLTIDWEGNTPAHGRIMAAARDARYQLMESACRQRGIQTLLVAHIASEQPPLQLPLYSLRERVATSA